MYGVIAGGQIGGAGAAGALAATGFSTLAVIVACTTLIAAGLSIWKLAPRRRRNDG
ncbi:hypothetical protein [Streptomyces sp. STCH 565 A]|uniref:hypothetical protein n=1 Tax=Streptomyces sp. STCH 565 A TaxID=2950532 RepID=UPI00207563B6|nr:hypothetical protein [Streptomyces sp. STCH 565 A]MCM8548916.1 hypothetical protein [Streptomyces sp. STCH 565 A]